MYDDSVGNSPILPAGKGNFFSPSRHRDVTLSRGLNDSAIRSESLAEPVGAVTGRLPVISMRASVTSR